MSSNHTTDTSICLEEKVFELKKNQVLENFSIVKFKKWFTYHQEEYSECVVSELEILYKGSWVKLVSMELNYSTILCMAFPGT